MDWISGLFQVPSAIQAIIVLSLIGTLGLSLGKLHYKGISVGIAFVFFIGIFAGHFGLSVDVQMRRYAETFGLVIFVYTLGLHVGPNFFGSLRHEGVSLNLWSLFIIMLGTLTAVLLSMGLDVPLKTMVGLLCGATTNTPALGAAQQALSEIGYSSKDATLGCAVTYPLGVLGVLFAMILIRKFFVSKKDLINNQRNDDDHTYVAQFRVVNPGVVGRTIAELSEMSHIDFVISRIWRGERVIMPMPSTRLALHDTVLAIMDSEMVERLSLFFGQKSEKDWNDEKIDWNKIDSQIVSRIIVITKHFINGKRLGDLRLRCVYGVNVSRVIRGDTKLLARSSLRLQYGDRLTVVGDRKSVDQAEQYLGNKVKTLNEPNLSAIYLGLILGLAVGTIPIFIPGMSAPIRLGVAGGPILMGILIGALGSRFHLISYTTRSASLMLRKLGLSLYLACLGLDAGPEFFATVIRPEGLLWVGVGFVITIVPVLIVGLIALKRKKMDYGTVCGIICGAMANPMALTYADEVTDSDSPSITYATVYPLDMFVRVIIAQVLVMFFV